MRLSFFCGIVTTTWYYEYMLLAPCKCPKIACRFSNVPTTCPQQKLNQVSLITWRWWFKSTSKILCRIQGRLWPENCRIEGFPLEFKFKPRQGIPNLPFPACLSILCGKYVWLHGTSQKYSKINIKRVQSQSWPEIANLTARCCSISQRHPQRPLFLNGCSFFIWTLCLTTWNHS